MQYCSGVSSDSMQRQQRPKKGSKRPLKHQRYAPNRLHEKRSAARVGPVGQADETDVRLKYVYNSYMTNGAGGSTGYEWTPNAAYDVDPAFGSTATNSFDAYALMYSYYRVTSYRYKIEVCNLEAKPVIAYCYNTNTAVTGSSLDVYSGAPYCSTAMLGPTTSGSSRHIFSGHIECSKLLGSIEAETDSTTRALTTGVPSDLLFLSLFAQATGGLGTLTNGVAYIVSITMNVRFYGRNFNVVASLEETQARLDKLSAARQEHDLKKKIAQSKTVSRLVTSQ